MVFDQDRDALHRQTNVVNRSMYSLHAHGVLSAGRIKTHHTDSFQNQL